MLVVDHGGFLGFGKQRSFIPVDAITRLTPKNVYIDSSGEHVATAPMYDPELFDYSAFYSGRYTHYGYGPYWESGYVYPFLM